MKPAPVDYVAAGSLVGLNANVASELGVDGDRIFGQQAADAVGRDVVLALDLLPDGALSLVIARQREGHQDLEVHLALAVGLEDLRRHLAELEQYQRK